MTGCRSYVPAILPLQGTPALAIALNERISVYGALAAGRIVGKLRHWELRPRLNYGGDDPPLGFDFIATSEQGRIATHGVEQEGLVGDRRGRSKRVAVGEIHVDPAGAHMRPRSLGSKIQRNALIRLDAHGNDVVMHIAGVPGEKCLRSAFEVNCNLRKLVRQSFAGPHIEGNTCPSPVVDVELHGYVGFGVRGRTHTRLLAIAGDVRAIDFARAVLSTDRPFRDLLNRHRPNGTQYLHFQLANGVGVEGHRWLHGR